MALHYYVCGVNGSGKTTLLKAISDKTKIITVQGTVELMEYLGIPNDYDALRALNQGRVLDSWSETASFLLQKYKDESFLLDTHIMNLTNGRMIRRDGPWIGKYDVLLMVKANPETILSRIENDSKQRALFPPNIDRNEKLSMIDAYQQRTESLCRELEQTFSISTYVLTNDNLETAVSDFIAIDERLSATLLAV
jgi:adenylate kinase